MTIPAAPFRNYPSRSTNTVWQKFKVFKDMTKSKTRKTGLGPKLTAAEKAWAKIPWTKLDAKKLAAKDLKTARANLDAAEDAMKLVEAAKTALEAARDKAEQVKGLADLSQSAKRQAEVTFNGLKYGLGNLAKIDIEDFKAEVKRLGG